MLNYLKLRSGDELFGEVLEEEEEEEETEDRALLRLVRPWRLLLSAKGYVPMPMPLDFLDVKEADVLIFGVVDADLAAAYRTQMGGLVTPPPGLLVPGGG